MYDRNLLILSLIAGIAMAGNVDTALGLTFGIKGSDERLEWCDAVQDGCHDVGCKSYKYGEENEDPKGLVECYDQCNRDYESCMNQEARKGNLRPALGKGDTGGVLREPSPSAPDTKDGTVTPSPYGSRIQKGRTLLPAQ